MYNPIIHKYENMRKHNYKMEEITSQEFVRRYPTMGDYLKEFPVLTNYVTGSSISGTMIVRANIVIVNIRNILGWSTEKSTFKEHITDVTNSEQLYELSNIMNDESLLILMMKIMVETIIEAMGCVFENMSPEEVTRVKNIIYNMMKE
jgi:hypothetical protein